MEMKAEIVKRVQIAEDLEASESVRLDVSGIQTLFDVVGREWLRENMERRLKKRAAKVTRSQRIARFLAAGENGNTAIDSYSAFSVDTNLRLVCENGALLDLFTAARSLSGLLDLVKERISPMIEEVANRLRVTGASAARAQFEVEMLAWLLAQGHRAAFVPTESCRTPDIVVTRPDGDIVYVECARKDALAEDAQAAESFAEELTKYLDSQAHKRRASYWLALQLDAPFKAESGQRIFDHVRGLVKGNGGEFTDERSQARGRLTSLGTWGRVWSSRTLQNLPTTASIVYVSGDWQEGWSVSGYLFHATLVSVTFQTSRRLANSIEYTLRDKGKARSKSGQVPDGTPAVCAISLGTVDDATVDEVLAAAPRLLEERSAVSALVLYWSKRVAQSSVPIAVGWRAAAFRNPRASTPLPEDFTLPDGPLMVMGVLKHGAERAS